jgi:putative transposase
VKYEYRKITPEEREDVLRQRRERGYPLHAPPHPFRQAGYYLITAANFEHAPIMRAPERRTEFESRLLEAMNDIRADAVGWVILPNHYHILVGVESLDQVSAALKQLHGSTSREWNLADGQTGKRRVWYKFSDRRIRSNDRSHDLRRYRGSDRSDDLSRDYNEAHFYRALNYIHYNPVKHGYVTDPYDWPWLSLSNYLEAHGREWLREKWKTCPPGDFGKGWDD